jgi:hypothetical protein
MTPRLLRAPGSTTCNVHEYNWEAMLPESID